MVVGLMGVGLMVVGLLVVRLMGVGLMDVGLMGVGLMGCNPSSSRFNSDALSQVPFQLLLLTPNQQTNEAVRCVLTDYRLQSFLPQQTR